MVGVGSGQQSRVDWVKLAGRKVLTWCLPQHPLGPPLQGRSQEYDQPLTNADRAAFLSEALMGVSISSDAFFPFRDSIDHAAKLGVVYLAQPGGSVQDGQITEACEEHGMAMGFTGVQLFHH